MVGFSYTSSLLLGFNFDFLHFIIPVQLGNVNDFFTMNEEGFKHNKINPHVNEINAS